MLPCLLSSLALSCAEAAGSSVGKVTEPRAFDLPTELPPHVSRTPQGAHISVLEQPLPTAELHQLVRRFMKAVAEESNAELSALFGQDATVTLANGVRTPAVTSWLRRFSALDYGVVDPEFCGGREDQVIYSAEDAIRSELRDGLKIVPHSPDEHLIVIAINEPYTRLFGAQLQILVTRTPEHLEILHIAEDFSLR